MSEIYIWISRWEDFQHYKPERDRAPAWIKNYTKQLDDWRYLQLTGPQRGLLQDLRMCFARAHGELPKDTRFLSQVTMQKVRKDTLASLNHAGFIEFFSREALDQRLEEFYSNSSPHARPRARREGEKELEPETEEPSLTQTLSYPTTAPSPEPEQPNRSNEDHSANGRARYTEAEADAILADNRRRRLEQEQLEQTEDFQPLQPVQVQERGIK